MLRGWYWQKVEKTWCSASMVPRHQGEVLEQYINDWQNWYLRVLTVSVAILVKMLFTVITPIIPGLPLNIVCFMTDLGGLLLSDLDIARSSCWCEIRLVQVANNYLTMLWWNTGPVYADLPLGTGQGQIMELKVNDIATNVTQGRHSIS